jgi:hypothetical protein
MSAEVCAEVPAALQLVGRRRFEAVFIDLQLAEQARSILEQVRHSPTNKTSVTFTVCNSNEESSVLQKAGSNFILKRPLSSDAIGRTLKAAYGMIVRERRRYFRCPIAIPLAVQRPDMQEVQCQTVNISEGGVAVTTSVPFQPGVHAAVLFTLPGSPSPLEAESVICWYDEKSRAGLQFVALTQQQKSELQAWLSRWLEQSLPESVAEKFRSIDPA